MASRHSTTEAMDPEDTRRTRVLRVVDRTNRIVAMLDRWDAEEVGDEPEWDIDQVGRITLRPPSP